MSVSLRIGGSGLIIGLALCSTTAAAQSTPAPRVPTYSGPDGNRGIPMNGGQLRSLGFFSPERQSRGYFRQYQQILDYSRCAVQTSAGYIRAAVDNKPMSNSELADFRDIRSRTKGCYSSGVAAPVSLMRGGLSETLYKSAFGAGAPAALRNVTQENYAAFIAAGRERNMYRLGDEHSFADLATCLVVRAPDAADAVLRTDHGSAGERTAMDRVFAEAPGCASTSSLPATSNRTYVRAYLAEALYNWANFQA